MAQRTPADSPTGFPARPAGILGDGHHVMHAAVVPHLVEIDYLRRDHPAGRQILHIHVVEMGARRLQRVALEPLAVAFDLLLEQEPQFVLQLSKKFVPNGSKLCEEVLVGLARPWNFVCDSSLRKVHEVLINVVSPFVPQRQLPHEWSAREVPGVEVPIVTLPREKTTECAAMDMKGPLRTVIKRERVRQQSLGVGSRRHQTYVVVNDVFDRILRIVGHTCSLYTDQKSPQETPASGNYAASRRCARCSAAGGSMARA